MEVYERRRTGSLDVLYLGDGNSVTIRGRLDRNLFSGCPPEGSAAKLSLHSSNLLPTTILRRL